MNKLIHTGMHLALLLSIAMVGCGGDENEGLSGPSSQPSTGTGGADNGGTGGGDSSGGTDPGTGGEDPGTGGTDPGTGGTDPGTGGTDPGTGGSGPDPNEGVVQCGSNACDLDSQVCCIGWPASYNCNHQCSGLEAAQRCDGPEDCQGAQMCCAGFPSGSNCKDACTGQDAEICHTDADCGGLDKCLDCPTPGGGPAVRMCVEKCPF